jgi:gamma-glutamyltranspeptidase/glutathione hydrolase
MLSNSNASRHTCKLLSGGSLGAVSAGHPLAVGAGLEQLTLGGTAVDAAVAAQAALCVALPNACGLGGDALSLVRTPDGTVTAVTGSGCLPRGASSQPFSEGGSSVTVPGIVRAWADLLKRWGRRDLGDVLSPAVRLAEGGVPASQTLIRTVRDHAPRLLRGGAGGWSVMQALEEGRIFRQPKLAATLRALGTAGPRAFYEGSLAEAMVRQVREDGGKLEIDDLREHESLIADPLSFPWDGGILWVQPPPSQGVLLGMACRWLDERSMLPDEELDHLCVELTEAVFGYRDRVGEGALLLEEPLQVDSERAARRGGPRSYLHTAGVTVADADGMVASSLVSLFDDFGSATFIPEGGFVLNNRAAGFTANPNKRKPRKRPVHTLAPVMIDNPSNAVALATPGADGQMQTLLQVLVRIRWGGKSLAEAIRAPRWRSENTRLLLEHSHHAAMRLRERAHSVVPIDDGDPRLGAVVGAGIAQDSASVTFAVADWRREAWAAIV